jgi:hypothetical protein
MAVIKLLIQNLRDVSSEVQAPQSDVTWKPQIRVAEVAGSSGSVKVTWMLQKHRDKRHCGEATTV